MRGTVAALVADGRYGDIAAVCEKAEVEVRPCRARCGGQLQPAVAVFTLTPAAPGFCDTGGQSERPGLAACPPHAEPRAEQGLVRSP